VRRLGALSEVSAAVWDGLANPAGSPRDPFISHAFLEALEASGSVGPGTGWQACHLLLLEDGERVVGAMPLYLKSHSYGEFVFDHAWADAFQRAGGRYYPKLQAAVPFTPVTGPRLLAPTPALKAHLLAEAVGMAEASGISSLHLTFLQQADVEVCAAQGLLARHDLQYHFENVGYADFGQFLATLSSNRRKNLRKERERAREGLDIVWKTGSDLTEGDWDVFFACYTDTGSRKWGSPYLNRRFFSLLGERMADHCVLMLASRGGQPVAAALNLIGGEALYGRYWGRLEDVPFLHFELCYYQAIDFALAHGLKRVEAGAQGEHKLARGYEPVITRSAHHLCHPGLRLAVERFLEAERAAVAREQAALEELTPFRQEPTTDTGGARDEP
jgi:predicted N-acyltransferase